MVKFKELNNTFDIELIKTELNVKTMEFENSPDCLVGSWGANRWFLTEKGLNKERYKSIRTLKQAITLSAKMRGLTVELYELSTIK